MQRMYVYKRCCSQGVAVGVLQCGVRCILLQGHPTKSVPLDAAAKGMDCFVAVQTDQDGLIDHPSALAALQLLVQQAAQVRWSSLCSKHMATCLWEGLAHICHRSICAHLYGHGCASCWHHIRFAACNAAATAAPASQSLIVAPVWQTLIDAGVNLHCHGQLGSFGLCVRHA